MSLHSAIKKHVFSVASTDELYNPYRDCRVLLDRKNGPAIRRQNLLRYVSDHTQGVDVLLVAEAPGPWGCGFSGVPITSESQLLDPSFPANGEQSSLRPKPYSEYSANIFWRVMQPYYFNMFVWNAVPLHPHRKDEPLTIRTPRQAEINQFLPVLAEIEKALAPTRVLAIGRKAEDALVRIGLEPTYVRHPSQGGAKLFESGIRREMTELGLAINDFT
jgi:uracil-DNA glycosylase